MNMPIDLLHLLLFTMPGFFFVWAFSGRKNKSDFEYLMFSVFWGILLMFLYYEILPADDFAPMLENPYAGAITFSILALVIGWPIRYLKNSFNIFSR